jgi:hypothetical protein
MSDKIQRAVALLEGSILGDHLLTADEILAVHTLLASHATLVAERDMALKANSDLFTRATKAELENEQLRGKVGELVKRQKRRGIERLVARAEAAEAQLATARREGEQEAVGRHDEAGPVRRVKEARALIERAGHQSSSLELAIERVIRRAEEAEASHATLKSENEQQAEAWRALWRYKNELLARAEAAEAQLATARRALEPFAVMESRERLDKPDTRLVPVELRYIRAAAAALKEKETGT